MTATIVEIFIIIKYDLMMAVFREQTRKRIRLMKVEMISILPIVD